jgi:hypothetical protein
MQTDCTSAFIECLVHENYRQKDCNSAKDVPGPPNVFSEWYTAGGFVMDCDL